MYMYKLEADLSIFKLDRIPNRKPVKNRNPPQRHIHTADGFDLQLVL